MKPTYLAILAGASVALGGCGSFQLGDYLQTWEDVPVELRLSCRQKPGGAEAGEAALGPRIVGEQLPRPLAGDKAAQRMAALFQASVSAEVTTGTGGLELGGDGDARSVVFKPMPRNGESLSLSDMEDFAEHLARSMPNRPFAADSIYASERSGFEAGGDGDLNNGQIFLKYFMEYATKGFVSRSGEKLDRPAVSLKFDSAIFGAATQILVESQMDGLTGTPVLYKGGPDPKERRYMPKEKNVKPTAVALGIVDEEALLKPEESRYCGITEAEYKIMRAAAAAAADGGAMVSSALLEFIGDIELSFVVGAGFSVGDAETVPTIAKTFVHTTIDGAQEALLYKFFSNFSYVRAGDAGFEAGEGGMSTVGVGGYHALGVSTSGLEVGGEDDLPPQILNILNLIRIVDRQNAQLAETP